MNSFLTDISLYDFDKLDDNKKYIKLKDAFKYLKIDMIIPQKFIPYWKKILLWNTGGKYDRRIPLQLSFTSDCRVKN